MSDRAWKAFERAAAAALGAKRFWANAGERVDFEGEHVVGQCKLVQRLSLEELTCLAEEVDQLAAAKGKVGVVAVKVRRGSGSPSPMLIVLTEGSLGRCVDPSGTGSAAVDPDPG